MRMNPLKCAFRVFAGKFLRFLVHSRGIDVDPAKAIAKTTMKPPVIVKELKSFLGKVSYIQRFIPGLAQSLQPLPSYSRKDKNSSGERHSRQPLEGYSRL